MGHFIIKNILSIVVCQGFYNPTPSSGDYFWGFFSCFLLVWQGLKRFLLEFSFTLINSVQKINVVHIFVVVCAIFGVLQKNNLIIFLIIPFCVIFLVIHILFQYVSNDFSYVRNMVILLVMFRLLFCICHGFIGEVLNEGSHIIEMRRVGEPMHNLLDNLRSFIHRTNHPPANDIGLLPLTEEEKEREEQISCQRLSNFANNASQLPVYNGRMDNESLANSSLGSKVLSFHNDYERPFYRLPTIKVLRCLVEGNLVSNRFHHDPIRNGILSELAWFHSFRGNMPVLDRSLLFDSEITSLKTTKTQVVTIGTFGNFPSKGSLCFSREPGRLEVNGVLTPYISSIELVVGHCPAQRFTQLHYLRVDHAFLAEHVSLSWVPRTGGSFSIKACVKLGAIANSSIDLLG